MGYVFFEVDGIMNKILYQGDFYCLVADTRQDAVTPEDLLGLFA